VTSEKSEDVTIEIVTEVTDELAEAWTTLLPQLSSSASPLTRAELEEIVDSRADTLFIARVSSEAGKGTIAGSLSLVVFRIPDGVRAWVESVVVDERFRGNGIGEKLSRRAIEQAQLLGAKSIDLTSRPTREAANRLYQKIGFEKRETNVYRYQKG
jgi:ribosomal protein S18 acetylase RimI-like enzyme